MTNQTDTHAFNDYSKGLVRQRRRLDLQDVNPC